MSNLSNPFFNFTVTPKGLSMNEQPYSLQTTDIEHRFPGVTHSKKSNFKHTKKGTLKARGFYQNGIERKELNLIAYLSMN